MVLDPALRSVLDAAVPFALPLRRPFRGTVLREGMLVKGPPGWGEFAPFDDYSDAAAARNDCDENMKTPPAGHRPPEDER